jgi:hypothetical protein
LAFVILRLFASRNSRRNFAAAQKQGLPLRDPYSFSNRENGDMTGRAGKVAILAATLFGIYGCAAAALPFLGSSSSTQPANPTSVSAMSASVPKPSSFDYVSRGLKIPQLSPAALLDDSLTLEAQILEEQCRFNTADPVFLVPSPQSSFMFNGRFEEDGQFQALVYRSMLTLGLGKGTQQLNTWPVKLASLSDMPKVYLEERLALVANAKLASQQQQDLAQEYIDDSRKIQATVKRLEASFRPDEECALRYRRR